ncbi:MAG TPA: DNA polymerase III subunit delta' [Candidatus Acidoferrales bacterium]|nr:DNA polymerase III subunit delta' [Candidatus Acidoferrales bacterium]
MPFSAIVGHEHQLRSLRKSLECDRLHHAYLFVGPEGVGKKTVALALAKALHCRELRLDFCDHCPSCLSIRDGNCPDVHTVEPQPGKKDISIGQIRELIARLSLRSFSGKRKVALVDPADLMNYHAQNALLKTLEEPPENSLLILVAQNSGALLPTVLSRCVRVSFGFLPIADAASLIARATGLEPPESQLRAALALGSVGQALAWTNEDIHDERKKWIERYAGLRAADCRAALGLAEELAADKERCAKVLRWLEGWSRDLLAFRVTARPDMIRNVDLLDMLQRQAASASAEQLLEMLAELAFVREALKKTYNRRMILENFFVKLIGEPQALGPRSSHG